MTEDERWIHLAELDDELLKGGVVLSEWCGFIVRDADTAFAGGAYLASILVAVAGIETHLRAEQSVTGKERLVELIRQANINSDLKSDLHTLRKYRNKWVHVEDPWDDEPPRECPKAVESELEKMAFLAVQALRRTIYKNQWV
jgi:hypothetical protein